MTHPFCQYYKAGIIARGRGRGRRLVGHRVLICDRDTKWSGAVQQLLDEAGLQVVRTPFEAPNANAYAERFVRSIKAECLHGVIRLIGRGAHGLLGGGRTLTSPA